MIKESKILVNITNRNINYYKKLGYNNFINNKLEMQKQMNVKKK